VQNNIIEYTYKFKPTANIREIFGSHDIYLKLIEEKFGTRIVLNDNNFTIIGNEDEIKKVVDILEELFQIYQNRGSISVDDIKILLQLSTADSVNGYSKSDIFIAMKNGKYIYPKTEGQLKLLKALEKDDVVFIVGPAGTGKTYLSVAQAVAHLEAGKIKKIILSRPAVEAGESLGFLPGDFKEKVDPYLKPLYDALEEMLPKEKLIKLIDTEIIEVVPLAFMRGRTLNNAFVILDEAQNSTFTQMKMFLTRLGRNTKSVITGDITQIDLPRKSDSGLVQVNDILQKVDGVGFTYFNKGDVVRHKLVKDIINAYEKFGNGDSQNSNSKQTE
jgi:phosphate starvation-inducible PhoH-like protein